MERFSANNFYATSAPETFLRILTSDFYVSNRPSRDMIQILEKDEIVFMLLCSLCVDGSINSDSMHPIGIQVP
jgi:hypothetical protein